MAEYVFDQIMLKVGWGYNPISVKEWLEISLDERTSLLLKEKVEFFFQGRPIPVKAALKSIKQVNG